jgi:hypothetical protein
MRGTSCCCSVYLDVLVETPLQPLVLYIDKEGLTWFMEPLYGVGLPQLRHWALLRILPNQGTFPPLFVPTTGEYVPT